MRGAPEEHDTDRRAVTKPISLEVMGQVQTLKEKPHKRRSRLDGSTEPQAKKQKRPAKDAQATSPRPQQQQGAQIVEEPAQQKQKRPDKKSTQKAGAKGAARTSAHTADTAAVIADQHIVSAAHKRKKAKASSLPPLQGKPQCLHHPGDQLVLLSQPDKLAAAGAVQGQQQGV